MTHAEKWNRIAEIDARLAAIKRECTLLISEQDDLLMVHTQEEQFDGSRVDTSGMTPAGERTSMLKTIAKLNPGQNGFAAKPIVSITGRGSNAYVWFGNDDPHDMRCLGTLGRKAARTMARRILRITTIKKRKVRDEY